MKNVCVLGCIMPFCQNWIPSKKTYSKIFFMGLWILAVEMRKIQTAFLFEIDCILLILC